jgi:hypothetical protein
MRKVMLRAEHRPKVLECAIKARENNECGFFYDENRDAYAMFNFREIVNELKRFNIIKRRQGHRSNDAIIPPLQLQAIDHNNQTKMVDGKPVYLMVLQQEHSNISPLGLGFDDSTFLVSGWIYCFFDEKIRDTLFKKFFLLEEPPLPPTPIIPTPKIKKNRKPAKCVACNSPALLKCGKCRRACYCSAECQRGDWLHHKEICEGCN